MAGTGAATKISVTESARNYTVPMVVLTSLFFMWGVIACMNDILIPFLKKIFELSRAESMLVQMAFFTAYFSGSLIYFLISSRKGDPIEKIGYKNGILIGLTIAAVGCALFYPAAQLKIYWFFLAALFILAFGLAMLQIASNPYVAILGPPETASSRLNLSQGFNSLGTTLAPIVGGYFVFHFFANWGQPLLNKLGEPITTDTGLTMSALGVQLPYLIFALIFILLAVLVYFTDLPVFKSEEKIEKGAGALRYRHLTLGMVAIFLYVGGEVAIGSLLINYIYELIGLPEIEAKSFLAFYWGGLMIGRFLGAISLRHSANEFNRLLVMIAIAAGSYLVIYLAVYIESGFTFEFSRITPYFIFMVLNLIAFRIGRSNASKTLLIFSIIIIGLLAFTMMSGGTIAMWTVLSIGLFNSIMWSNIFTLAIRDLGKYTSQGSSLLIMSVLGGAVVPWLQAMLADHLGGYHYSFFIPMLCYVYLAWYGLKGYKVKIG
ncbi:MAG: sugar MFS transporter [Cyclobacteriaceae bacterium]|nr:sugar MFS transporter [Cyclobacteriaceae bacterium]